ncbi:uncharacterized protein LOC121247308 [Juglans microcarpa x Juglans regia]|uniref:uncharacterized protein LOC121247308 n=1 Tax=Juglans microcarpa x Juglans regia TaxID=2249226 RepID=UPI001B7DA025|nr:uncharacterized protein LOC121247308 [Juglans microcarpa x Juglans regia]
MAKKIKEATTWDKFSKSPTLKMDLKDGDSILTHLISYERGQRQDLKGLGLLKGGDSRLNHFEERGNDGNQESKNTEEDGPSPESEDQWVQGVVEAEEHGSSLRNVGKKVPVLLNHMTNPHLDPTMDTSKSPAYWSRVCLCNMARLAKEATTVRRVLEPLFHSFDDDNHWSPEKGVASSVLMYFQSVLEESGDNSHLLLSILINRLDHKDVVKQPRIQINIVNVTTQLAKKSKEAGLGCSHWCNIRLDQTFTKVPAKFS